MKILNKHAKSQNISNSNDYRITNSSASSINLLNMLFKQENKTKFSPCQSCPSLASHIIERYFSASLRQRKTPNSSVHSNNLSFNSHNNNNNNAFYHQQNQQRNNDLMGTANTNNSLFSRKNSPTSSLISFSGANLVNSSPNGNQTFLNLTISPSHSPSPPPSLGAVSLSMATSPTSFYQSQCFYVNECHTFILPNEIEDFSPHIQNILFDELLDREVQHELENESRAINWNVDLNKRLNSRLYPLWNRHSGDCLLDSVLQACYGVFDTDNTLRKIMAESLEQYANCFKPRWKEHETLMAKSLDYTLDDYQLEQDWDNILSLANKPGIIFLTIRINLL